MKTFKTVTTQKITALVCESCGLEEKPDDYEFHEFISVNQRCGYGSIHAKMTDLIRSKYFGTVKCNWLPQLNAIRRQ